MFRKIIGSICVLFMLVSVVFNASFAEEEAPKAHIVLEISEKSDSVDVSVAVKNTSFVVMQATLRYNDKAIVPVDVNGEETKKFKDFASLSEEAGFLSTLGEGFDAERKFFEFVVFVMPETESEYVNENYECASGEDGLVLYNFKFKRIAEGDCGIEIARKDESKTYNEKFPQGIGLMDFSGNDLVAEVTTVINGEEKGSVLLDPSMPEDKLAEDKPTEDKPAQDKPTVNLPADEELSSAERKKDVICLKVGKSMTISYGLKKNIDDENPLVVPYIIHDRTMVPIRFISEALGADVLWENGWSGCIIKKAGKEIKLEFGSSEFFVNGEKFSFEVPVEVVHDRTMVPIRFVSEQLDCDVYWEAINSAVIISPKDNPWQPERKAEINAINEMLLSILNIL